ncbi:hypothetical protein BGW38_008035 [Lunasporangiospora selenospora]|uniref:C2H2-type domain-containing protein n=1 Tax=Lunasporangiospora selenospora TaxID=979761 RepID=A0A9P6K9T9_9FUNG|nr:hypothetical protein BGW38_008035 [Lunasporangiospora selenospora]
MVRALYPATTSTTTTTTLVNPLNTPQTPSLDLLAANSDLANVRCPIEPHGRSSAPSSADLSEVDGILALIRGSFATTHPGLNVASSQTQPLQDTSLETPFSPYLGTPFETPFLGDFGSDNDVLCMSFFTDLNGLHGTGQPASLFPENVLLSPLPGWDGGLYPPTIEPATLFMPQQQLPEPVQGASPSISDLSSALSSAPTSPTMSDISLEPLASAGQSIGREHCREHCREQRREQRRDQDSSSMEEDTEDEQSSHLDIDSDKDDVQDDVDDDDVDEDEDDDKDEDFIPHGDRKTSGSKRKADDSMEWAATAIEAVPTKKANPSSVGQQEGKPYQSRKNNRRTNPSPPKRRLKPKKHAAKRFSCIIVGCNRRFARLFNLHTHERTHDPDHERPHICPEPDCGKAFSRKHDMQRHEASVHKGERNFSCPACQKPFSRHDGLRRHLSVNSNTCGRIGADSAAPAYHRWITT